MTDELWPLPKMHERSIVCRKAEQELLTSVHAVITKYSLTTAEQLQLVNMVAHDFIAGVLKFAIRVERHGDVDKPGDIE